MAQVCWETTLCIHQGRPRESCSQQRLCRLPPRLVHIRASDPPSGGEYLLGEFYFEFSWQRVLNSTSKSKTNFHHVAKTFSVRKKNSCSQCMFKGALERGCTLAQIFLHSQEARRADTVNEDAVLHGHWALSCFSSHWSHLGSCLREPTAPVWEVFRHGDRILL